jgi:hypothetical protein
LLSAGIILQFALYYTLSANVKVRFRKRPSPERLLVVVAKHVESCVEILANIWSSTSVGRDCRKSGRRGPYESGFIVFEEAIGSAPVAKHFDFGVGGVLLSGRPRRGSRGEDRIQRLEELLSH